MTKKKTAKKAKRVKAATAPEPVDKFAHIENEVFRRALEASKGYTQLAAALGISRQSVHKWDAVPDRFAVRLEELYGIPRALTAPHLYAGMKSVDRAPQPADG